MSRFSLAALLFLILTLLPLDSTWGQSFQSRTRQQSGANAKRLIELRVQVHPRSPLGTQQEWMKALAEVGAEQLKVESSKTSEPSFEEIGTGTRKTLAVTAIVKRGKLHLPGGKFTMRQTAAIKDHLDKLRADGGEATVAKKVAFGLTAKQLIGVHEQFEGVKSLATKDQSASGVARSLMARSGFEIKITKAASQKMAISEETLSAEMNGFTTGTSLAYALRAMGLVFRPQRKLGQPIELIVDVADPNQKNWPVGWPVVETMRQAAPKMYTKIDLQVQEQPIMNVLAALETRGGIPFMYDETKIKLRKIDLPNLKVTYAKNKTTYHSAALGVLRQSKPSLKFDLRIDETGKRFFWISPVN